ncbi:MAG: acetoacetate--CoA ligase [Actinomycetota bacterium]
MNDLDHTPLWTPTPERIASSNVEAFRRRFCPGVADSDGVWRWSEDRPGEFWRAIWDVAGVIGEPGQRLIEEGETFRDWRFLPDAELNVAENLLADRPGSDAVAIIETGEGRPDRSIERARLRSDVAAIAAWLRSVGVGSGDRVAAWMPHVTETIVAFLAANSVGAVFTSTSADFGPDGVVDRFGQTTPTVLVAADGYRYGGKEFDCLARLGDIVDRLPSVEHVLVVESLVDEVDASALADIDGARPWSSVLAEHGGAEPEYLRLPTDHPLWILYSSGTTGVPKCIVHRSGGGLLKLASEHLLHCDIRAGDRVFYFTTCGWMMWNWLVGAMGTGATIVLYDGNPASPGPDALFDLVERHGVTLFGVSAKYIDASRKAGLDPATTHELGSVRTICSTGSPLSPEGFQWVYDSISADVHLQSMSGGTDLCGCLVAGDPTKPVYSGAIQRSAFGLGIEVFDDDGRPVDIGVKGELVCTTPFPSMPLGFWGDEDDTKYRAAYFERFHDVWAHGDFASWTAEGGIVIHGRSDATLNASGVRIGTAEIYRVVEQFEEVVEAIAIGQEWDDDTRVVLFVRLADGATLDDELRGRLRSDLRTKCSPRHVPAIIAAVSDIPRTRSGKIVEMAVTEIIHARPVKNVEALANPDALDLFVPALESEVG